MTIAALITIILTLVIIFGSLGLGIWAGIALTPLLFPALTGAWLWVVGFIVGVVAFIAAKYAIALLIAVICLILAPFCAFIPSGSKFKMKIRF